MPYNSTNQYNNFCLFSHFKINQETEFLSVLLPNALDPPQCLWQVQFETRNLVVGVNIHAAVAR